VVGFTSQMEVGGGGAARRVHWAGSLRHQVFFRPGFISIMCVERCLCVFRGFCVPHGANELTLSAVGEVTSHWIRTDILHSLAFPQMLSLLSYAFCEPFNVDRPRPHPSLEGRGDVVVVGNVVLAVLEWWREGFCENKLYSVQ